MDSEGRPLPGGTGLLWSKTLGKGKPLGSLMFVLVSGLAVAALLPLLMSRGSLAP